MKTVAFIPARYEATRFPGKLMQILGTKTVIRHTYENTRATGLFDEVIVVTDSDIIRQEINQHGGKAIMSMAQHESGSDRIAEAVKDFEADLVVNVQGDEPFVEKEILQKLINVFEDKGTIRVASLMHPIKDPEDVQNPNYVKVVIDNSNHALYFSRSPIPYQRNKHSSPVYYKHIGIYAFRKAALLEFTSMEKTALENTEMLEQLRYLENGIRIRMVEVEAAPLSIDTREDLLKAQSLL